MAWVIVENTDGAKVAESVKTHEVTWGQAEISPSHANGEAYLEMQAEDEFPMEALDDGFILALDTIPE